MISGVSALFDLDTLQSGIAAGNGFDHVFITLPGGKGAVCYRDCLGINMRGGAGAFCCGAVDLPRDLLPHGNKLLLGDDACI